jgi:ketosteroid isomerase-like protein
MPSLINLSYGTNMNRFASRSSLLLLSLCLGFMAALPSYSQAGDADKRTFIKLQHDWAEARKKGDVAFLENFYAKEFTVGTANGTESSRAQDLEMFSSGDMKPTVIKDDQMKVYIYGNTALVTGVEHVEGTYKGHAGLFDTRFANVFVYRDHRWQLVHA